MSNYKTVTSTAQNDNLEWMMAHNPSFSLSPFFFLCVVFMLVVDRFFLPRNLTFLMVMIKFCYRSVYTDSTYNWRTNKADLNFSIDIHKRNYRFGSSLSLYIRRQDTIGAFDLEPSD